MIREHSSKHPDAPLFLYLPHQAVHVGNRPEKSHPQYALNQAPQEYIEQYAWVKDDQRRNLSAMVAVMDEAAGNITSVLKDVGMWNDTIFIFSTDNGGPINDKASNFPLRGGKATLWEGGVRGVGFVAGGDLERFGFVGLPRVSQGLMHVSDWSETMCELAGGGCAAPRLPLDGVSAAGLLRGTSSLVSASNRSEIVHELCRSWMGGSCAEHEGQYAAITQGRYKLVVGQEGSAPPRLFDVLRDPGEQDDLAPAQNKIVQEMLKRLDELAVEDATGWAHDREAIDPRSDPRLHGGAWVPWMP